MKAWTEKRGVSKISASGADRMKRCGALVESALPGFATEVICRRGARSVASAPRGRPPWRVPVSQFPIPSPDY